MFRPTLLPSLVLGLTMALGGCVAQTGGATEEATVQENGVSASAHKYIGSYSTQSPSLGGFAQLRLEADGTYSALLNFATFAVCEDPASCFTPVSGDWKVTGSGKKQALSLRPEGGSWEKYGAKKTQNELQLTRDESTQRLASFEEGQCNIDADCESGQSCPPPVCLMWCPEGDPTCCGPSTCVPNEPEPCWGAWLDQNGVCRTPSDGVYPDSCCAGEPCGPTICDPGRVCCNPLDGICTLPDEACTQ